MLLPELWLALMNYTGWLLKGQSARRREGLTGPHTGDVTGTIDWVLLWNQSDVANELTLQYYSHGNKRQRTVAQIGSQADEQAGTDVDGRNSLPRPLRGFVLSRNRSALKLD